MTDKRPWHETIHDLSPVEKHGDIWFKREDKFAPMGYGGINGSKLRVCIWLISEAVKAGAKGVIHGAVTGSPQHPMVAAICRHYNIPCVDVIGTKDIDKHKNLVLAQSYGAKFEYCNVGYAKTLEKKAYQLRDKKYKDYFVLETNITLNDDRNSEERIAKFHGVGAFQALNGIPEHIETVILPAGSCNSAVGALYGLAMAHCTNPHLKTVILMGIGNYGSKDPDFIRRRLEMVDRANDADFSYIYDFKFNAENALPLTFDERPVRIEHYDLNGTGYCEYNDLMPYTYHGVVMHPRYEGKIFHYMKDNSKIFDRYMNNKTLFWIVGSEPQL